MRTRTYEAIVRSRAVGEVLKRRGSWSLSKRYAVTVDVYWADARRRDLDNQVKSITDPMNKVVFADDSQIAELHAYGRIDRANPRVEVEVRVLSETEAA